MLSLLPLNVLLTTGLELEILEDDIVDQEAFAELACFLLEVYCFRKILISKDDNKGLFLKAGLITVHDFDSLVSQFLDVVV